MADRIDVVIVGAGIAGLSAAVFLARAGRQPVIFDGGRSRIETVSIVRELPGFDGFSPHCVLQTVREEAIKYGALIRKEMVTEIEPLEDGAFLVRSSGSTLAARIVILATGLIDELPDVRGITEPWGDLLKVCPCFDGHEVKDQKFVVFGLGDRLAHMASWVSMWSTNVTVVSDHQFDQRDLDKLSLLDINIVPEPVAELCQDAGKLVAVKTSAGRYIDADAAWVAMKGRAASSLAAGLCNVDTDGFAITDPSGATSRPGVFAVGNSDEPWAHLAHAAASGTTVGPVVVMYLLERHLAERRATR